MFGTEWIGSVLTDLTASSLFVAGGFVAGRLQERRRLTGRPLHDYFFYPYAAWPENFA